MNKMYVSPIVEMEDVEMESQILAESIGIVDQDQEANQIPW